MHSFDAGKVSTGYFTAPDHDGDVYIYLVGEKQQLKAVQNVTYTLIQENRTSTTLSSCEPWSRQLFTGVPPGRHIINISITGVDGGTHVMPEQCVDMRASRNRPSLATFMRGDSRFAALYATTASRASLKGHQPEGNITADCTLHVMFTEEGHKKFRQLKPSLPAGAGEITLTPFWDPAVIAPRAGKATPLNRFFNMYQVQAPLLSGQNMIDMADALEALSYVEYAAIGFPVTHDFEGQCNQAKETTLEPTPDLGQFQTYLDHGLGMNVRAAWASGASGTHASVRFMDFGVFENHEDLRDFMTVVSNEGYVKNHGSAAAGCIAAGSNGLGVSGVAKGVQLYMYDTGSLARMLADFNPGDIVSFNIQGAGGLPYAPAVNDKRYWDAIRTISEAGGTALFAGGNGGMNILGNPEFNDFGDSCGIMVGSCNDTDGTRREQSNYNLYSALNAWGWNVATTGSLRQNGEGADLWDGGSAETRYMYFSGTSSANPLTSAALAVVQSHVMEHYNLYFDKTLLFTFASVAGYTEATGKGIGVRPNLKATLVLVDEVMLAYDRSLGTR